MKWWIVLAVILSIFLPITCHAASSSDKERLCKLLLDKVIKPNYSTFICSGQMVKIKITKSITIDTTAKVRYNSDVGEFQHMEIVQLTYKW